MQPRTHLLASTIAFALVASTGIGLLAQDKQVGGQTIAAEDMIVVQIHCNDLVKTDSTGAGETVSPGVTATGGSRGPEAGEVAGDPAGGATNVPTDSGSGGAGVTVGQNDAPQVDLAAITLENCKEAGLVN